MNKLTTEDFTKEEELYDLLMQACKKAKELGSKEIFEAITKVKLQVIRL